MERKRVTICLSGLLSLIVSAADPVAPVLAAAPGVSRSNSTGAACVDETDVCIYGGTPSGITAELAAVRRGHRVIMVTPHRHVGGMHASGLRITGDCHYLLDMEALPR